ncbi:acyl-CoA N-acyltransferase [Bombardia bombarda]|uniref:Acyl-CoA N-acyltransferase n=1 Tax=Bombardia bombarda TaxID=252184 RepID=A0AA39XJC8_9PEZI|nr:acyl-CoA N-acyltransferase [Bombardia bombarda]
MGTPFVSLLKPSTSLSHYDRTLPPSEQIHPSIPTTFRDAMIVREQVYVHEQGVPLPNEFDTDDPRACHWVVYASISQVVAREERCPWTNDIVTPRRSETKSVPIGTIRLVPFPHPPHPRNGGVYVDGMLTNAGEPEAKVPVVAPLTESEMRRLNGSLLPFTRDRATDMHDGLEPYVKLGRLAVVKEFRGRGIAGLLIRAALGWMQENPTYFNPSVATLGFGRLCADTNRDVPKWHGLFCCHAQDDAIPVWSKHGFKADEAIGHWLEEGIPHVGMFLRLPVDLETHRLQAL